MNGLASGEYVLEDLVDGALAHDIGLAEDSAQHDDVCGSGIAQLCSHIVYRQLDDFDVGTGDLVVGERGVDEELDAQVEKVILASPKWKPARIAGREVSVRISVPVEFKLTKSPTFKIKK